MKKLFLFAFVATAIISHSDSVHAKSGKKVGKIPVTEEFSDFGWEWHGGGRYVGKIFLTEKNGGYALCGAGYSSGGIDYNFTLQSLQSKVLLLNNKPVLNSFSFFTNVRTKKRLMGGQAKCKMTSIKGKLKKSDKLDVSSTKTKFWN
jgi:hypothetical protein